MSAVVKLDADAVDAEIFRAYWGWRADAVSEVLEPLGACVCFLGVGQLSGQTSCMRTGCLRGGEDGPRAFTEPCDPNEEIDPMTNRTDALPDIVSEARAKRDYETATAWIPTASAVNTDAKAKAKGARKARRANTLRTRTGVLRREEGSDVDALDLPRAVERDHGGEMPVCGRPSVVRQGPSRRAPSASGRRRTALTTRDQQVNTDAERRNDPARRHRTQRCWHRT